MQAIRDGPARVYVTIACKQAFTLDPACSIRAVRHQFPTATCFCSSVA